ncbi:MAG: NAD(P)-dependent oxidoreductase [Polyangiaceae bacterium]
MSSFPVALDLSNKPCLVVGSGLEACERARALRDVGALVEVVSAAPSAELGALCRELALPLAERPFTESDLDGKWLAVLVDRDLELGAHMASLCHARRLLFCATDQPQNNSFSHMALARAGLVVAAIGTQGRAPALGRKLREELSRLFDAAGLADFAEKLAQLRDSTPPAERRALLGAALAHVRIDGALKL